MDEQLLFYYGLQTKKLGKTTYSMRRYLHIKHLFFVMILDETGICKIEVNSDITTIKCQQWIDKDISLTGIDY